MKKEEEEIKLIEQEKERKIIEIDYDKISDII